MADPKVRYFIKARVELPSAAGVFQQEVPRELLDDPVAFRLSMRLFDDQLKAAAAAHQAKITHQHELWMIREKTPGDWYCSACGDTVPMCDPLCVNCNGELPEEKCAIERVFRDMP